MKFYFYNSYQQSFAGFQASAIQAGDRRLRLMSPNWSKGTVRSCLMNSGTRFLLYRNRDGDYVMCAKGLSVKSATDDRKWYINFAVRAKEEEMEWFRAFTCHYCYQQDAFLKELSCWFIPTPEAELSYSLDMERFEKYLSRSFSIPKREKMIRKREYAGGIDWLAGSPGENEIGLLIPEADENYFRRMNPAFARMEIQNGPNGNRQKRSGRK